MVNLETTMKDQKEEKRGGTTATTALFANNKVTFSNIGDSRTILFSSGGELIFETKDHIPNEEGEGKRIKAAGGEFYNIKGVIRMAVDGMLAMSRSLGDGEAHSAKIGIISEPDVISHNFKSGDIVMLASDGFWDKFPDSNKVAKSVIDLVKNKEKYSLDQISAFLVEDAESAKSKDDITILLIQKR